MSVDVDVAVVGGGVVGCAVARTLADRFERVFLFERNQGITRGDNQSSRNSGVVHAGIYYDRETRPLKARLCVEGNRLLYDFCERHGVPVLRTGKLVVACEPAEERVLDFYRVRAEENGVRGVRLLSAGEIREMEPNVRGSGALFVPTSGIVEPTSLVRKLATSAENAGAHVLTGTTVTEVEYRHGLLFVDLRRRDGRVERLTTRYLVNAAGVAAPELARRIDPESSYVPDPVRGEWALFYRNRRSELFLRGMNVYPVPTRVETPGGSHFTVGVHLTPTLETDSSGVRVSDTVTVGPWLGPVTRTDDLSSGLKPPEFFHGFVHKFFPGLEARDLHLHQAGIQARLRDSSDFVFHHSPKVPGVLHLLGMDSPGLTACLAIAEEVRARLTDTD